MSDDATILTGNPSPGFEMGAAGDWPAALVTIAGEVGRAMFDLDRAEHLAGRGGDADILLLFPGVSRRHALFRAVGEDYELVDLDSKNGSFVNDVRIEGAVLLKRGDVVRIGPATFKYLPKGDPERVAFEALSRRVDLDRFTGCYNKSYFNEQLALEARASAASGSDLSLVVLDLDHFKKLNDGFGHDAGDFVLKRLAALVRDTGLRRQDVFARYGGEEFVLLLPNLGREAALGVAERIRAIVAGHAFEYEGRRLPVTVSLGVAVREAGDHDGVELFRRADAALYRAKQAGRNQVQA